MSKGGRRSTTWAPAWKSGKTTVIRVPEVLVPKLLRMARVMDEGQMPVTGDSTLSKVALKEAANAVLMTVPPRDRRGAKKLLYRFVEGIGTP